tara:strand:- start:51 stop:479 length:429 start_codon:yes stop_codon:yes gene_type:complete
VGGERERGASNGIYGWYGMNELTKKLTDKQTALVDTLVANGCTIKQAAEMAGYAVGESGRVTASKALKLAHVQQYMMRRMNEEFGLSATLAAGTVRRLAMGAKSEYVQLEASRDLLDRAGYKPIDRSQVQVAGDIKVSIDLG